MPALQSFAFPRSSRLTQPAHFQSVFGNARRSGDRYFTVLYRQSTHPSARIGFALPKKKLPLAVTRNRVRRAGRESFRRNRSQLPALDIVVLGQPAAGRASKTELAASLERHWDNLRRQHHEPRPRGRHPQQQSR